MQMEGHLCLLWDAPLAWLVARALPMLSLMVKDNIFLHLGPQETKGLHFRDLERPEILSLSELASQIVGLQVHSIVHPLLAF